MFNFDATSLLLSLLVSSVGFVLFVYGKKQSRVPHMGFGLVLCVYPYFVSSALWMGVIGVVLVGLLIGLVKLGW